MSRVRAPEDLELWFCVLGRGDDVDTLRLNTLMCVPEVVLIWAFLAMAELTKDN